MKRERFQNWGGVGSEMNQWRLVELPNMYDKLESIAKIGALNGFRRRTQKELQKQMQTKISPAEYQHYLEFYQEVLDYAD